MAQEFKPGQIVPESGIYEITHDPQHADMPHEVTVIKGRRFPTCRHCKGISFELVHAAKHVHEVAHLEDPDGAMPAKEHSGDISAA
jgi:hypothetical protein